jgi:hypothetical protein
MCESVPPASLVPHFISPVETLIIIVLIFAQKKWAIEGKYVEQRIIIEDMDRYDMWTNYYPLITTW